MVDTILFHSIIMANIVIYIGPGETIRIYCLSTRDNDIML